MGAFLVSIYEANILNQKQSIMVSQQKASVWPYLESVVTINVDEEYTSTTLFIENKGVGPAKLKSFSLILDETLVTDFQSIGKVLESIFENEENYVHSYKLPDGVLSANSTNSYS